MSLDGQNKYGIGTKVSFYWGILLRTPCGNQHGWSEPFIFQVFPQRSSCKKSDKLETWYNSNRTKVLLQHTKGCTEGALGARVGLLHEALLPISGFVRSVLEWRYQKFSKKPWAHNPKQLLIFSWNVVQKCFWLLERSPSWSNPIDALNLANMWNTRNDIFTLWSGDLS